MNKKLSNEQPASLRFKQKGFFARIFSSFIAQPIKEVIKRLSNKQPASLGFKQKGYVSKIFSSFIAQPIKKVIKRFLFKQPIETQNVNICPSSNTYKQSAISHQQKNFDSKRFKAAAKTNKLNNHNVIQNKDYLSH